METVSLIENAANKGLFTLPNFLNRINRHARTIALFCKTNALSHGDRFPVHYSGVSSTHCSKELPCITDYLQQKERTCMHAVSLPQAVFNYIHI